ncbi:unnamed protein product [Linum trigynum]|uniref:Uncharacterized protein n=1 Tax=Linum trigynum TaxID=586398 RepID=A0AAV2F514_9ROSI
MLERANEAIRFYQLLFGIVNQEVVPNRALLELLLNAKLTLEDGNSLCGTVLAMEVKEGLFAVDPSKAPVACDLKSEARDHLLFCCHF